MQRGDKVKFGKSGGDKKGWSWRRRGEVASYTRELIRGA